MASSTRRPIITLYNWGHLGGKYSNFGDKLMLETLLSNLVAHFEENNIDAIINLFTTNLQYTYKRIFPLISTHSTSSIEVKIHEFPSNIDNFLRAISIFKNSNVTIIGGGEIIYDKSSYIYSIINMYPALLSRCILFGVGASENGIIFTTRSLLNMIKSLDTIEHIFSRDYKSYIFFTRVFGDDKVSLHTDIAFLNPHLLECLKSTLLKKKKRLVIIPRIPFPLSKVFILNYLPFRIRKNIPFVSKHYRRIKKEYYKIIVKMVERIVSLDEICEIVIIPFSSKIGIDHELSYELKEKLRKCFRNLSVYVVNANEVEEVITEISRAKHVISSTFHGTIVSAMCRTKIACVSYSEKINEVCRKFDIPFIDMRPICIGSEDIELDDLHPTEVRPDILEKEVETARDMFDKLFEKIKGVLQ